MPLQPRFCAARRFPALSTEVHRWSLRPPMKQCRRRSPTMMFPMGILLAAVKSITSQPVGLGFHSHSAPCLRRRNTWPCRQAHIKAATTTSSMWGPTTRQATEAFRSISIRQAPARSRLPFPRHCRMPVQPQPPCPRSTLRTRDSPACRIFHSKRLFIGVRVLGLGRFPQITTPLR